MDESSSFDFATVAYKLGYLDESSAASLRDRSLAGDVTQNQLARDDQSIKAEVVSQVESVLEPLKSLEGYKVLDILGRGGMGVVFKALQLNLDRIVALKTILMDQVNATAIGRFEREARTLAKIQHPNIISIFDFGKCDPQFYFAMEFVEGTDVAQKIKQQPFTEISTLGILRQVVSGLARAATLGVVHRDIKPANILLCAAPEGITPPGNGELAKVADFGLAIADQEFESDSNRFTAARTILGSPTYMSPEQFDSASVDFRSDMYSCGATAYEMVSGRKPFPSDSLRKLITAKSSATLTYPIEDLPISDRFKSLLVRLLQPDPENRFPSYDHLLDELDQILNSAQLSPERTRIDAGIDAQDAESTFVEVAPSTQATIADKLPSKSRIQPLVLGVFVLLLGLIGWLAFELFQYQPGPRTLFPTASEPLYNGKDLTGWPLQNASGKTGTEPDDLDSQPMFIEDGFCQRKIPIVDWERYGITALVRPLDKATAAVHFGISTDSKSYGVVQVSNSKVTVFLQGPDQQQQYLSTRTISGDTSNYKLLVIEKQPTDWFVWYQKELIGTIPHPKGSDSKVVRLLSSEGKSWFVELSASHLQERK